MHLAGEDTAHPYLPLGLAELEEDGEDRVRVGLRPEFVPGAPLVGLPDRMCAEKEAKQ